MNSVTQTIIDKIIARSEVGEKKYGKTMARRDLTATQWAEHHEEELLDALQYNQRAKMMAELVDRGAELIQELVDTEHNNPATMWLDDYNAQFGDTKKKRRTLDEAITAISDKLKARDNSQDLNCYNAEVDDWRHDWAFVTGESSDADGRIADRWSYYECQQCGETKPLSE